MSEHYEIALPILPDNATLQLADPSLVNFYTDLDHRTYWLSDEINNYTFDLVQYIIRWNREDKGIPVEQRKPIRIIIDCPAATYLFQRQYPTLSKCLKLRFTVSHLDMLQVALQ